MVNNAELVLPYISICPGVRPEGLEALNREGSASARAASYDELTLFTYFDAHDVRKGSE